MSEPRKVIRRTCCTISRCFALFLALDREDSLQRVHDVRELFEAEMASQMTHRTKSNQNDTCENLILNGS